MVQRVHLLGSPHTYYVHAHCAMDLPLFAEPGESAAFLAHLERMRAAFDCRIHAFVVTPTAFHLALHHHHDLPPGEAYLRERWAQIGGAAGLPIARLQARLTSLGGFMQTLLQGFSRERNRRRAQRGSIWTGRYRACLLADDSALLAAISWLEEDAAMRACIASSRALHGQPPAPVRLAPPPLRVGPGGQWFPADDSPPGLSPPHEEQAQEMMDLFNGALEDGSRSAYGAALSHGWALGRPESLTDVLARLGRGPGRGRSRSLRDLGDDLGLCGVWG